MTRSEFDEYASNYSDTVSSAIDFQREPHEYFLLRKHEELLRLLPPRTGNERLLSVGSGAGVSEALLAPLVSPATLFGIDPSIPLTARAGEVLDWRVAAGLAQHLPFADATFDVVFATCVFHHIPPAIRRSAIAEMVRVARPGGLVCVFEHNPLNPVTRKVVRDCAFDADAVLLGARETEELLRGAGLATASSRYILFFPRMLAVLRPLEPALAWCAAGAQYVTFAHK